MPQLFLINMIDSKKIFLENKKAIDNEILMLYNSSGLTVWLTENTFHSVLRQVRKKR